MTMEQYCVHTHKADNLHCTLVAVAGPRTTAEQQPRKGRGIPVAPPLQEHGLLFDGKCIKQEHQSQLTQLIAQI